MKLDSAKGRLFSALCFSFFCHALLLVKVAWQGSSAPTATDNPAFSVILMQQLPIRQAVGAGQATIATNGTIPEAGGENTSGALMESPPTQGNAVDAKPEAAPIVVQPLLPFIDSGTLDIRPVPRSAPDFKNAAQMALLGTGKPIRLRIYVLESGTVYRVVILDHDERDQQLADLLATALRRTAFVPGRLENRDVASFMEVEFKTGPYVSVGRP